MRRNLCLLKGCFSLISFKFTNGDSSICVRCCVLRAQLWLWFVSLLFLANASEVPSQLPTRCIFFLFLIGRDKFASSWKRGWASAQSATYSQEEKLSLWEKNPLCHRCVQSFSKFPLDRTITAFCRILDCGVILPVQDSKTVHRFCFRSVLTRASEIRQTDQSHLPPIDLIPYFHFLWFQETHQKSTCLCFETNQEFIYFRCDCPKKKMEAK